MGKLDRTAVWQFVAEWLHWYRVWIGHRSPVEEREPVMKIFDRCEWSCFLHEVYMQRSIIKGSPCNAPCQAGVKPRVNLLTDKMYLPTNVSEGSC